MYQTLEQQKPNNVKEIENRNELADYMDKRLRFKGKCNGFKYNSKSGNYQITLSNLKPVSQEISNLKLDYNVNVFSKPSNTIDIGIDYTIEFDAQVNTYYTYRKDDGIDVKVKNYGLRLLEVIDFDYPNNKGEDSGDD